MTTTETTTETRRGRLRRTGPATNPPGRPVVWVRLLILRAEGTRKKLGPYRTHESAVASAAYFNRQMRTNSYYAEETEKYCFRGRGLYVVLRRARRFS